MGRRKVSYARIELQRWAQKMDAEYWKERREEEKRLAEEEISSIEEAEEESEEESEKSETEETAGPSTEELMKEKYRCRSAYKLIEINEKFKIFRPGQAVVDLGCCPGSWTQVAVKATQATIKWVNSLVVGLDILPTEPIEGAQIFDNLDFLEKDSQLIIKKALDMRRADVVLSDMAPNTSGIRFRDHLSVAKLCYSTLKFVPKIAKQGATLVMKSFDGEECKTIIRDIRHLFERGIVVHPKAIRKPSSEFYYVGLKYKGNKLLPRPETEQLLLKNERKLLEYHDPPRLKA